MQVIITALNETTVWGLSLGRILGTILLFVILVLLKRAILKLYRKAIDKSKMDPSLKSFIDASINVVLWIIIILFTISQLGVTITSMVAGLAVVGAALSLSIQSILENIFAGITILGTKPAELGEFVKIGELSGTVKKLSLFYTVLVAPDGSTLYVPNSTVISSEIINYSDLDQRRIELTIGASYNDEPDKVIAALIKAAKLAPQTLKSKDPIALVTDYGSSSIEYTLYIFCRTGDYLSAKSGVMRQVFYTFKEEGITFTYNHMNVHVVEDLTKEAEDPS